MTSGLIRTPGIAGFIRRLPALAAIFASLVADPGAHGAGYRRSELIERSPFGGPNGTYGTVGAYELRGFFGSGDDTEISILRTDTHEAAWVRVGSSGNGLSVESADPETGTASVVADGLTILLKLARPSYLTLAEDTDRDGEPLKSRPSQAYAVAVAERADARIARAREDMLARLRLDHPDYFKDSNLMTKEERRISGNALREVERQTMMLREAADDNADPKD